MADTVLRLCKIEVGKLIRVGLDMLSRRPRAMINYMLQGTAGADDWVWLADRSDAPRP